MSVSHTILLFFSFFFFFFNDTATTEIYTLSLHDALPICLALEQRRAGRVDDHEVGLAARLQVAHLARQAQGARRARRVLPPQAAGRQAQALLGLALAARHVGGLHGAEGAEAHAAAHVAGQAVEELRGIGPRQDRESVA